ncbi:MAG TPA: hypothetical protein DCL95_15895 [Rhodospirillaceae bacterium]|nr:hypothetical protein [Rhodospirillaceae bacterium]MAX64404.1 hypothetical protein [Rhodospirillaceae bacterium]MBB58318.1 hypothetical protein [Rhodospirillaceae bacterium]HAE03231.1 hypothetical protein [Rhodospirillaceae bacterium]HAJ21515.1 hypothetical protein [Rhodospirillaceae bacterium]
MSYKNLYEFAQKQTPKTSRNIIRDEALRLAGLQSIAHVKSGMDVTVCRGLYFSATSKTHKIVQQLGSHVIITERSLNECWTRFVYVKELMHVFTPAHEASDTGSRFEELLADLSAPILSSPSNQMLSEVDAFWMSLAVLCPEARRLEMKESLEKNEIDNYGIALELKIPEQYVPRLFEERYLRNVNRIIK